jgi:hypothetical protein
MAELYTRYNLGMTYEGKPVSLHPLKFEDAVKELLKAKPEPKTAKEKKQPKTRIKLSE